MTPPRLVQLKCPGCQASHWEIDCDYRGLDPDEEVGYELRTSTCPACRRTGAGYQVGEQSPPEFFLQPHQMYPMHPAEFDRWVSVLRENFPNDPHLQGLGTTWHAGRE